MTDQSASAVAGCHRRAGAPWRIATVAVVVGLCITAMVRLIISWDWNDLAAAKLLGLATAVGGLAVFVAVSVHAPDSVGVRKRWTPGRIVAAAVVAGLAAVGAARMFLAWDLGDRVGQLQHQTAIIALTVLYLVDWFPFRHARR